MQEPQEDGDAAAQAYHAGPQGQTEEQGDREEQDADWNAEDHALAAGLGMSHSLVGADAELGQGWNALQHSDLEYLDRLGVGEALGQGWQAESQVGLCALGQPPC